MSGDLDPSDIPSSPPPLQTAVALDQAGAHAAESSRHGPFHTHCENCAAPLAGPFCHRCGQHDFEFHRSFRHVVHDALENFFHFDAKLFRNVVTLLFQPGRLTAEFNAGKRASQVPPFRLYVFVAFIFFAIIFWGADKDAALAIGDGVGKPTATAPTSTVGSKEEKKAEPAAPETFAQHIQKEAEEIQRTKAAQREADPNRSEFEVWLASKGRRALDPAVQRELAHSFVVAMPKILFFCLPFYALYTRILFRKSGQVYLQHLVLALHFHTFIFLWVLWRDGWTELIGMVATTPQRWFVRFCNLWMFLYPFFMLRHLFRNSWPKTIFKTGLLGFGYFMTMAVVFGATAVALVILL